MAIVYRHIRLDKNQPFYIGIGKDVKRAFSKNQRSKHWKSIINKTAYEVEILFHDLDWEQAKEKEKEFIALYGKKENGGVLINRTDGGDGALGLILSEEQLFKRGLSIKSSWTDARKKEYSLKMMGKKNNFYGKKHNEETKKRMSINNNPRKTLTKEHIEKIRIANTGKKRSQELKYKLSQSKKGKPSWNKGVPCKEETKKKIRNSLIEFNNNKNEIHNRWEGI